ncbi:SMI1/KNR4 family protein [Streptomyces sp. NPDC047000]|uniref:SMI1/KNR4 family protein n=1 Tax=Streptomyces sp. NPDC047000 TaxID=3155474 RepID=UPI0033E492E1
MKALSRLVKPPADGGDMVDWDAIYDRCGLCFPQDYRDFVSVYGGGTLDDYLGISIPPTGDSFYGDLLDDLEPSTGENSEHPYPYPPYPGPEKLIRWASDPDGDDAFWVLRSEDPDQWSVAVKNHQTRSWSSFDGGMAEFLLAVITGRHSSPFSAALPECLALATVAARLADFDGARAVLRERVRFTQG